MSTKKDAKKKPTAAESAHAELLRLRARANLAEGKLAETQAALEETQKALSECASHGIALTEKHTRLIKNASGLLDVALRMCEPYPLRLVLIATQSAVLQDVPDERRDTCATAGPGSYAVGADGKAERGGTYVYHGTEKAQA